MNLNKQLALVMFALTAVVYAPTLSAGFVLDDYLTIVQNPFIRRLDALHLLWRYDPSRFLTHLSFALNYSFVGFKPESYHLVNLLLHLSAGLLVYQLAKLVFDTVKDAHPYWPTLVASAFLLHPIQTSAVSYIAQRATILSAICYLAALCFYWHFRQTQKKRFFLSALGVTVLGIFCKPTIVTLPLSIILIEVYFLNEGEGRLSLRRIVTRVFPFVVLVASVVVLLTLWRYKSVDFASMLSMSKETETITRSSYLLTQFSVVVTYLRLLIVPIGLNLDYDFPIAQTLFNSTTLISLTTLVLLIVLALRTYRSNRLISFGIFWFLAALSLESSIFPISDVIFEHRLYLPMLGFVFVLAGFIKNPRIILPLILVWAFLSFSRNQLWADNLALLKDMAQKSPQKARVHNNLGLAYMQAGKNDLALSEYNATLKLDPFYSEGYLNRGRIYQQKQDWPHAFSDYTMALKLRPDFALVYSNRGNLYAQLGDCDKAINEFNTAIRINPYLSEGYNNRAICFDRLGNYDLALADYNQALELNSHLVQGYNNRGIIFAKLGQWQRAQIDFETALKLEPDYYAAKRNLEIIKSKR